MSVNASKVREDVHLGGSIVVDDEDRENEGDAEGPDDMVRASEVTS